MLGKKIIHLKIDSKFVSRTEFLGVAQNFQKASGWNCEALYHKPYIDHARLSLCILNLCRFLLPTVKSFDPQTDRMANILDFATAELGKLMLDSNALTGQSDAVARSYREQAKNLLDKAMLMESFAPLNNDLLYKNAHELQKRSLFGFVADQLYWAMSYVLAKYLGGNLGHRYQTSRLLDSLWHLESISVTLNLETGEYYQKRTSGLSGLAYFDTLPSHPTKIMFLYRHMASRKVTLSDNYICLL